MKQNLRTKKLFLFDFDGTLADTSQGILSSINHTRAHYGLAPLAFEQARVHIGIGQIILIKEILAEKPEINLAEAAVIYRAHYETAMFQQLRFYPGMPEFLSELKTACKSLGIISNKYTCYIEKILRTLNCPVKFDIIIGSDSLPERKPSPRPLLYACEKNNITPADAVMFGDSIYDVQAGLAAGIYTIGCAWGFNGAEPFQNNKPDIVIQDISEI